MSLHPPANATELSQQNFPYQDRQSFRRRDTEDASGYREQTRVGELICILFGCSVPVVLRNTTDQESLILVTESYLHGLMDGKTRVMALKGIRNVQEFVLSWAHETYIHTGFRSCHFFSWRTDLMRCH